MYQSLELKWYVAQIKQNSYELASRNLERQGFETFTPKMKTTITKKNKFINKNVLVFPGYMFVGIGQQSSNLSKINSTYGIAKILDFNNKPYEISTDLIHLLKDRYEENCKPTLKENLQTGDTIKFSTGPFSGLWAKVESLDHKKRIWVLLEVMGAFRKLKIQEKEVIKIF